MENGQAASQAIHASRLSFAHFLKANPQSLDSILSSHSDGTVVVLTVPDLGHLERLSVLASRHDLPWAAAIETDYQQPPFDGNPTTTALAIGPALRSRIKPLVRAYPCL